MNYNLDFNAAIQKFISALLEGDEGAADSTPLEAILSLMIPWLAYTLFCVLLVFQSAFSWYTHCRDWR